MEPTVLHDSSSALQPVIDWFRHRGWQPFCFQQQLWQAYLDGRSGLVHAPTGIGKTYAAWFGPVVQWMAANGRAPMPAADLQGRGARDRAADLQVVWVTPLRALGADIAESLQASADGLALPWSIECRTGDTSASLRAKQKQKLPTALITTPESLTLLLSYPEARQRFHSLQAVVVDEWHELVGSKRGVLTELALARLRYWHPDLRVWGLSATLGNTADAMAALLGDEAAGGCLIRGRRPKKIEVQTVLPAVIDRFPWSGHLGLSQLDEVAAAIETAHSTLVFTNTRSQAEIWFQALCDKRPGWRAGLGLHHGSLDRRQREKVEERLRSGMLKAVVCTSSLDLGVDFTPVDQVIQIGSPKGVARLMQRAGRSGHRPGEISRVLCVPTNALELIEFAAARTAIGDGRIEPRRPVRLPLDVLCQHLVTSAVSDGFEAPALYRELKTTHAFRELTETEFQWALEFVSSGGACLKAYPEYAKLIRRNGRYVAADNRVAVRHRMNIGTITSDAAVVVKFLNGKRLGSIEERFVARLKRGDTFVYGGAVLEFVRMKEMTLWVRRSRKKSGPVPQWIGGRMPLSTHLADAVRRQLESVRAADSLPPELQVLAPLLDLQSRWSLIPGHQDLLVETLQTREGRHLFLYTFEGWHVNEGIGALLALRLSRQSAMTLSIAVNDYGLEILSDREMAIDEAALKALLGTDRLLDDMLESLNATEMARRQFREIARVAGLVFQGYPGRRKTSGQVQASAGLLYSVFERYDPQNLLLKQSVREVLEKQLEFERLHAALQRMSASRIRVCRLSHPTPLAFPIMVNRLRSRVSSEKLADRIRRMQVRLEKAANRTRKPR